MSNHPVPLSIAMVSVAAFAAPATAQISIGTSTTAFNDISSSGTAILGATDDSEHTITAAQLAAAGFNGNGLLGVVDIRIGNNGAVLWNNSTGSDDVGYINSTVFPTMNADNTAANGNGGLTPGTAMLCPLWDDNFPSAGNTNNALDWQVIGGNLIIQWSFEDHFNAQGTGTVQYQAIVYGGVSIAPNATLVEFVYNDTLYSASAYQNDGGSATIGYKNWGTHANANDVEFGTGGGTNSLGDPPFGDPTMQPKVGGYAASNDPLLPHALRIFGTPPPVIAYCAAKLNSQGCVPSIGFVGNPSASAGSGFTVSVANVINNKAGLFLYTNGGRASGSFAGGVLCVNTPIRRSIALSSGGSPPPSNCTGVYAMDFNSFARGGLGGSPAAFLSVIGTTIDAQTWGPDNGFASPNSVTLSNGLEWIVGP